MLAIDKATKSVTYETNNYLKPVYHFTLLCNPELSVTILNRLFIEQVRPSLFCAHQRLFIAPLFNLFVVAAH